jgi:hypothetical protein
MERKFWQANERPLNGSGGHLILVKSPSVGLAYNLNAGVLGQLHAICGDTCENLPCLTQQSSFGHQNQRQ